MRGRERGRIRGGGCGGSSEGTKEDLGVKSDDLIGCLQYASVL